MIGLIQEQRHDYEEAAAAFQRAVHLSPHSPRMQAALGHLYAVTGDKESCMRIIEELKAISASRYVSPFEFGSIYFALGMMAEAFEWFDRACRDRSFELLSINVDPRFELLRRDARFEAIARQVGLVAR